MPRDYPSISSTLVASPLPLPSSSIPDRNLTSSLSSLSLHARTNHARTQSRDIDNPYFPPTLLRADSTATLYGDEERAAVDAEIGRLMLETRLWRIANSAQWVAWGVVQARVPGFAEYERKLEAERGEGIKGADTTLTHPTSYHPTPNAGTDPLDAEAAGNVIDMEDRRGSAAEGGEAGDDAGGEAEEFDYLNYTRERAMFFWGDCLQLGFVSLEELEGWGVGAGCVKCVGY